MQTREAQFASLWRPDDTRIITLDGREDIGWVEFRQTGDEIFLKQLYISPAHQRRGIGSQVMRLLLNEQPGRQSRWRCSCSRIIQPFGSMSDMALRSSGRPTPRS